MSGIIGGEGLLFTALAAGGGATFLKICSGTTSCFGGAGGGATGISGGGATGRGGGEAAAVDKVIQINVLRH